MKRFLDSLACAWRWPWLVCVTVLAWKLALFALATLPVPANDSFFYDGPVVNLLLHGRYVNPPLALALPISGTEVFSAYPPLYQGVLLLWMKVLGTSVQSAVALHLLLFAGYAVLLVGALRRLAVPAWAINLGALFLLAATFHDRPDTLAQCLGAVAVCGLVRARATAHDPVASGWLWLMAMAAVLCLACSLQFGATFVLLLGGALLADSWRRGKPLPWGPLVLIVMVPLALVATVKFAAPRWWEGFLEHAQQTPSLTGWRVPSLNELLKIARSVPGVIGIFVLAGGMVLRRGIGALRQDAAFTTSLAVSGLFVALSVTAGALLILTANVVMIPISLQPLVVACGLRAFFAAAPGAGTAAEVAGTAVEHGAGRRLPRVRTLGWVFASLAALAAIRAVGMSTWGLACAADVNCGQAQNRVRHEVGSLPAGQTIALSSAYLYAAVARTDVRILHCDWLAPALHDVPDRDRRGLIATRPTRLVLTQFDYFRRYEPLLRALEGQAEVRSVHVENTARVRAPDSIPAMQRVLQHVAWAPVVVDLEWSPSPEK